MHLRLRVYICYDSKKRSDYEQKLKSALMGKMKELDGKTFDDSARLFAKKTGWMSICLEYELDGKGCMEIGYRNNAMTFFRNRAGIFIMLAPSTEWETVMTAYDARNNVEMTFDMFKNEPNGDADAPVIRCVLPERQLIKFLALIIGVCMQIAVSKANMKNLTVENTLMSALTYEIFKDCGVNVCSEKTKRVRDIFEVFRVEDLAYFELDPWSS